MKKFLSIFLAVCIMLSVSAIGFDAYANTDTVIADIDTLKTSMSTLSSSISSSKKYVYNGHTYYTEGKELYSIVRNAIDNTKTSVIIYYYTDTPFSDTEDLSDRMGNIIMTAWSDDMSVTSTDGDYVHWSISSAKMKQQRQKTNYYKITITLGYYNTPAQEKAVDAKVDSVVNSIRSKNWSDYQILKYVHDYICNSTTYDYDAVDDPDSNHTSFTAYGALIGGKAVCQGYANAFYRICRELGYDVRFTYSNPKWGCHAWNMVLLDGKAYYVDCTWDDNIMDDPNYSSSMKMDEYYYFLVDYKTLRSKDALLSYTHTLDNDLTSDESFVTKYQSKTASTRYNVDDFRLSTCTEKIAYSSTAYSNGASMPNVTIVDKDGNTLIKDIDYRITYSSNSNCGRAMAKIVGLGKYSGMNSQRTFIIKPKKMSAPTIATNGRTSSSITIKWVKADGNVSGYKVQSYSNGSWKTLATISSPTTTSFKISSLLPAKKYTFRVRAFVTVGKVNQYGDYSSSFSTYTSPSKPTISLSTKSKSIKVDWRKVLCSGYEIQYATNSSMKNAKTIKVSSSSLSKTIKSLRKGKRYYVRVRSYQNVKTNSKTRVYRSAWSAKKSITVK